MSSWVDTFPILLDSRDGIQNGDKTYSHVTFPLRDILRIPPHLEVNFLISSFTFFNTMYNVTKNQTDTFTIELNHYESYVIILPEGNYDLRSLLLSVNTIVKYINIVFIYNELNRRLRIQSIDASDANTHIKITFPNRQTAALYGFSFLEDTIEGHRYIDSTRIPDASGLEYIDVYSDLSVTSHTSRTSGFENILCRVPINEPFGSQEKYSEIEWRPLNVGIRQEISSISIHIKTPYQTDVDFNGHHWNLTILCRFQNKNLPKFLTDTISGQKLLARGYVPPLARNVIDSQQTDSLLQLSE